MIGTEEFCVFVAMSLTNIQIQKLVKEALQINRVLHVCTGGLRFPNLQYPAPNLWETLDLKISHTLGEYILKHFNSYPRVC